MNGLSNSPLSDRRILGTWRVENDTLFIPTWKARKAGSLRHRFEDALLAMTRIRVANSEHRYEGIRIGDRGFEAGGQSNFLLFRRISE